MCIAQNGYATVITPLSFELLDTKAHDTQLFTQGLEINGDHILESSGLYNRSLVRIYHKDSGALLREKPLPKQVFAEGLTLFNQQVFVLTWRAGLLFILDPATLNVKKTLPYKGQGWGLTHNDTHLFMSDGSHSIQLRNPETFEQFKTLSIIHPVTQKPIRKLNELEFAQGVLWANQWQTNLIYALSPINGEILGILDLTELVPPALRGDKEKVLNGIAYDPQKGAFWITGKNWPTRYLIRIKLTSFNTPL
ncbi:glutaminyl-peptide cyclotransferase [Teredinibacter purpureus]|uniref:glutaminyl-peptide cyclotransferase n=1 Tax=Teredinibacter purpureus TaxID=2731756 RepID=UPI0005F7E83F|nr:glutaminyl-peptide cyclotransferase [Teredinibacter purpureus]